MAMPFFLLPVVFSTNDKISLILILITVSMYLILFGQNLFWEYYIYKDVLVQKNKIGEKLMGKSNYEKYAETKQQELLRKERNLQQAINCLRDKRKFASLQCIDSAIDFVADLYDLSIDEVRRAMDGEEYWCI